MTKLDFKFILLLTAFTIAIVLFSAWVTINEPLPVSPPAMPANEIMFSFEEPAVLPYEWSVVRYYDGSEDSPSSNLNLRVTCGGTESISTVDISDPKSLYITCHKK